MAASDDWIATPLGCLALVVGLLFFCGVASAVFLGILYLCGINLMGLS